MVISNVIIVKVNFLEVHQGLNHTWPELKVVILLSVKLCLNLFKKKLMKQPKGQIKHKSASTSCRAKESKITSTSI